MYEFCIKSNLNYCVIFQCNIKTHNVPNDKCTTIIGYHQYYVFYNKKNRINLVEGIRRFNQFYLNLCIIIPFTIQVIAHN